MKKILLFIGILSCWMSKGQTPDYISAVNTTGGNSIPLGAGTTWDNYRSQFLYPEGDFGSSVLPGLITAVYFKSATNQTVTTTWNNFVVAIGQNNISALNAYQTTGMDTVLNAATLSVPPTASGQWIRIELEKAIFFDPALPLIIDISQQGKVGGAGGYALQAGAFHGVDDQVYGPRGSSGTFRNYAYQFGMDILPKQGFNNGGVNGASSTQASCPGSYPIAAMVRNFGENQIDSVDVNWSIDGVLQTPVTYRQTLDTADGSGNAEASVVLGNHTFAANTNYILKVWTSNPNGMADTVNYNDTLTIPIRLGAPTGLDHGVLTSESAELRWDTILSTDYNLIYGPLGFDPDTGGTEITGVSSPYILPGLLPNTNYDFYIYADCGGGTYSDTSATGSFLTLCAPYPAPYMLDFEVYDEGLGGPDMGQCVNSTNSGIPNWRVNTGTTSSASTGPDADHTLGTDAGKYVYFESNSGSPGLMDTLYMERVDISGLSVPYLSFWYHMYGETMGSLRIEMWNGSEWDHITTISGEQQSSSSTPWINFELDFDSPTDTVQFRFIAISSYNYYSDMALDDIEIKEAPPCVDPQGLNFLDLTAETALIEIVSGGNDFIYEFGPAGYQQGTGTQENVGNPVNLDSLQPGTSYDFYISRDCGPGGMSSWIGPFTFITPCIETVMPYIQSFDNWPPQCMDLITDNDYYFWQQRDNYAEAPYLPGVSQSYMTTQPIIVTDPARVSFWWSHFPSPSDSLVLEMQVNDSETWENLMTLSGDYFSTDGGSYDDPGDFIDEIIYLDSNMVGDTVKLRLGAYKASYGDAIYVNDLVLEAIPPCPAPRRLILDTLTASTATVSFESYGSEVFEYEYGPTGYTVGNGTIGTGGNPITATGMSGGTVYDMYVRSDCNGNGNGNSDWVGPISFTTPCDVGLSGTYTIDPAQPASATNFTTIDSAVASLNLCGVSGPVVFNIKEGSHMEQIDIAGHPQLHALLGAGPANTITFQSDPSNTTMPEIAYSAGGTSDNFVVRLRNASHVIFKDLAFRATGASYGRVVELSDGNNHHISFIGDSILTDPFASSSNFAGIYSYHYTDGGSNNHITLKNNIIVGGYYSIRMYGSSSNVSTGLVLENNEVKDWYYYGIYTYYMDSTRVADNIINTNATAYYPVYIGYGNYSKVLNNEIDVVGSTTQYPLYIYYSDGTDVIGNNVNASNTSTNYGIRYYYSDAPDTNRALVANNMLSTNSGSSVGYGLSLYNSTNVDVVYNTVNIAGGSSSSRGLYLYSGSGNRYLNNNIVNTSDGFAIYDNAGAVEMDYNNYYTTGDYLAYTGGDTTDLAGWQAATEMDSNSVSGDPIFIAPDILRVLGGTVNNAGTPFPDITIDIQGETRSTTTPDIGADEYTPVSGDLELAAGEFSKDSPCLSNSDTIAFYVRNIIGDTVDFSVDPLTINYTVSGPVNSSGTITQNTGSLYPDDTLIVLANNIDLSAIGTYSLEGYIDPNGVNLIAVNDTLINAATIEIDSLFRVSPKRHTLERGGDSILISARSPFFIGNGKFLITEVCHFKTGTGAPSSGWPSYLVADDYIEITGVPGSDLGGVTLEQWQTSLVSSYTFPSGTMVSPEGTAVIAVGQLGGSVESPSDYYYHGNGSFTGTFGSTITAGRILKDANGNVMDAVVYGSYSFPSSAGVTATDWSGTTPSVSSSGNRLEGPDDNTSANWINSGSSPQDPNVVNNGVIVPSPEEAVPGFTWTLNGTVVDSMPAIYVGPFTNPGDYEYIASFVSPCGITYTDTVVVTMPSCPQPYNLQVSGITSSSVILSWISSNNATSWQVLYDTTGFDPSTGGNTVTANTNPFTLTGLTPNMVYDYYIISDCGSTDGVSEIAGPVTFRTPCAPISAPYLEDFEQFSAGFYDGEENCWIIESNNPGTTPSGGFSWEIRDEEQTTSTGTGPAGDHTYYPADTGKYFHSDNSGGTSGDSTVIISPLIDVSTLTNPELKFFVYFYSTPTSAFNQTLGVDIYNGNNWIEDVYVLTEPLHTSSSQPWDSVVVNLAPYSATSGMVMVRFKAYTGSSAGGAGDISIDQVGFGEGPSCPAPVDFKMISSDSSTATLGWTPGSSNAADYVIEYDTVGFSPGTGIRTVATGNSSTISTLPANIPYEAYLKANCGMGDSSSWVGPVTFGALSLCDDLEAYSAGPVEGSSLLFKGWYGDDYDAVFSTTRAQSGTTSLHITDTGSEEAADVVAEFASISSGIWDISFSIYVENGSGAYYNIQQNYDPTETNQLWAGDVYFTDDDTAIVEHGSTIVGSFPYTQGQWEDVSTMIDLDNDTVWIELNGASTGIGWAYSSENPTEAQQFNGVNFYSGVFDGEAYDINYYMDDFCVSNASLCPVPSALGASNITDNSADVYWTTGGASSWNVEYGEENFTPGTGTMISASNDTLSITALSSNTCYDFYVQDNCGADSSNWVGPYTFCTEELILCLDAGDDNNTATVCDTVSDVDLTDFLNNADAGGSWIDADGTGALSGSIFDATTVSFGNTYDFWYVIAATADCPADSAVISVTVDSCDIGLEENILSRSLNLYPNPTSGDVYIDFETADSHTAEISILDLSGKLIYKESTGDINGRYEGMVSLGKLAKGTYLLKIESGDLKAVKRIIKQ